MASSKLFLGNLSELTSHIIQYLRRDLGTLHSCILVNRLFCRITIPILWEDPFSVEFTRERHYNFFDIYFSYLIDDDKKRLSDIGIKINPPPFIKPLFSYPSFIKTLNLHLMKLHTDNLTNDIDKSTTPKSNLICILLFKLFIDSNVSLKDISMYFSRTQVLMTEICKIILNNANNAKFMSNVEKLHLGLEKYQPYPTSFLATLPSLIPSIKHLSIWASKNNSFARNLIQSQAQLLSLSLSELNLDSLKCYNTLTSIKFVNCNFANDFTYDGLKNLTQLKSLHFNKCSGITTTFLQPLFDITPLKIKSLKVVGVGIRVLDLLLQKIGSHLENLELNLIVDNETYFASIMRFCDKIKFLYLYNIHQKNFNRLNELITHFSKSLRYLSIKNNRFCLGKRITIGIISMILKVLGQMLPDSLEYLNLDFTFQPNDLKVFLDNCRH
ncbi:7597_t:CDS:1, partial [Funneliformis geosporum]